jgi:hypothetical protein
MLFRKKFGFLVVLAVFFLIFAAGCDSGSNGETEQPVVTTVETETDFSGALASLTSGETIEISSNFGTETSSFQLDKVSGTYSITGVDENSLKKISGDLTLGSGSNIDLELANLELDGTLIVDIGSGDLNLNNVSAQRLEIKSAGSESVHLNQNSVVEEIEISGKGVRLLINTEHEIGNLEIKAGADDVEIEKGSAGAKIREALVNGEKAKFKNFKSGDFQLRGTKNPEFIESKNSDDEQDDSTSDKTTVELEKGYLNLYMSSEKSLNAVQLLNNGNAPEKPGKPENPGNSNNKEISEINVVIERIEFNKSDGSGWQEWEAFSGPQAVNLLSENLMEEFQIEGEVEAGEFDSLRLYAAAEYNETIDEDDEENAVENEGKDEEANEEESDENSFSGTSHLVYADGSKEALWVHAASKAGIKIKGDFKVEAGTSSNLNISFDAAELINMRGPKVAPMLLPKAFKMEAELTQGALAVEVLNFEEVEVLELLLEDSEGSEYSPQQVEGESGLFIFSKLTPGEYQLSLKADGYQNIGETVSVEAGQRLEKTFTMEVSETETEEEEQSEEITEEEQNKE